MAEYFILLNIVNANFKLKWPYVSGGYRVGQVGLEAGWIDIGRLLLCFLLSFLPFFHFLQLFFPVYIIIFYINLYIYIINTHTHTHTHTHDKVTQAKQGFSQGNVFANRILLGTTFKLEKSKYVGLCGILVGNPLRLRRFVVILCYSNYLLQVISTLPV